MQRLAGSTPLQTWLVAALDVLDDARAELDEREYETLLDIVATRIARDYVRLLSSVEQKGDRAA
jgi:hypothetical protein